VPSWNDFDVVNGEQLFHRPPVFLGSTVGGLFRQRGFATTRLNHRSGVNCAAE